MLLSGIHWFLLYTQVLISWPVVIDRNRCQVNLSIKRKPLSMSACSICILSRLTCSINPYFYKNKEKRFLKVVRV